MFISYVHWEDMVRRGAAHFDLTLTEKQIRLMYQHAEALQQWTKITNLTAITDPQEIVIKHFIDSLAPAPFVGPMYRVLDVGAGGGFPGLPLKILCPSINLTMIDAVRKKTSFLQHVIRSLMLEHVRAIHGRIEDMPRIDTSMPYDTILCRALGNLSKTIEQTVPMLSAGGKIVAWKGRMPDREIREAQPLLENEQRRLTLTLRSYRLPILEAERTLVILTANEELT